MTARVAATVGNGRMRGRAEHIELEPHGSAIMTVGTRDGLAISGAAG
jgi:hypothetical protein